MLSYTTPATIARNNAEAARIIAAQDAQKGHGVDRDALRGHVSEPLAAAHADALARRNRG